MQHGTTFAISINCNSFGNLFGLVDLISGAVRHGICKRAIATKVQVVIIFFEVSNLGQNHNSEVYDL